MQVDIFGDAAVVGVEVAVVPLIAAVVDARTVLPAVVAAHGDDVLAFFYIRCKVEATGHDTIF